MNSITTVSYKRETVKEKSWRKLDSKKMRVGKLWMQSQMGESQRAAKLL